jgi:hypothetical protein
MRKRCLRWIGEGIWDLGLGIWDWGLGIADCGLRIADCGLRFPSGMTKDWGTCPDTSGLGNC